MHLSIIYKDVKIHMQKEKKKKLKYWNNFISILATTVPGNLP